MAENGHHTNGGPTNSVSCGVTVGGELMKSELLDGSLSKLLEAEDFDEAFNVSITYLNSQIFHPKALIFSIFLYFFFLCATSLRVSDQLTARAKNVTIPGFLCTLVLYYAFGQFSKFSIFQIKAHQQEWVKTTEGVLKDLLASQDKDTLQLLKEAAEQSEGVYSFLIVRTRP